MISQQPGERCYHIFYQLLAGADQELLNELLLSRQVKSYRFVENGEVSVDNIDDAEEYTATLVCTVHPWRAHCMHYRGYIFIWK